jgi:hypothetical protein
VPPNPALQKLDVLVGAWTLTMSMRGFSNRLAPRSTARARRVVRRRLLMVRSELDGEWTLALGRSDAHDEYTALYHDDRGVCHVFAMSFDGERWMFTREDPDFHQRFIAEVGQDRVVGRWEASEDAGRTWRKDFDLIFSRA